jgi:DNA polymerase III subunit gamma/tau
MNLSEAMRPTTLDEVIGNNHIVKPLRNQLDSGTLSQTLMLTGIHGSGKTSIAKIIASSLGAEVHEVDCGSDGGVDRMREIVESSAMSSLFATNKVFILDEVHGLSKQAQSALLKTLEEPQSNLYFILLTTDAKKLLPTIRSRCVTYETKPASNSEIGVAVKRVLSKYNLSVESMKDFWVVIEQSGGSLRQVYAILEKLVAVADNKGFISSEAFHHVVGKSGQEEIDENLPQAFLKGDISHILESVKVMRKNESLNTVGVTIGIYNYLKKVYVSTGSGNTPLLADLALLLTHKQIEWEHIEWLAWKHTLN